MKKKLIMAVIRQLKVDIVYHQDVRLPKYIKDRDLVGEAYCGGRIEQARKILNLITDFVGHGYEEAAKDIRDSLNKKEGS